MSTDIGLGIVGIPNVGAITKKPLHLIVLVKGKQEEHFLSLDKPELLTGFIQVKGFFCDAVKESDGTVDFNTLTASTPIDKIVELMLPTHRVVSVKNLAFKAKQNNNK